MPFDMFIKIEDIPGEAKDAQHKDEIDVLSWSWGLDNAGTASIGRGGGAGKANFQDLSFSHSIDKSSPILMLSCANGKHIPEALLTVRKAGGDRIRDDYLFITMKDILVTSVSSGGSGGEDILTENVTLNFANVKVKYIEQDEDGTPKSTSEFGWNIATNKPA